MNSISHLPDPNNSIGNEDKKNNNRLYKGGGCFLSLFKQSQHLEEHTEQTRKLIVKSWKVKVWRRILEEEINKLYLSKAKH